MQELFKKIKKWLEKISVKKSSYAKEGIKPKRDWYIILFIGFILVCVLADFARYLFKQIDQGKLFAIEKQNTEEPIIIDSKLLQKTIDDINFREKNLNDFRQNRMIPQDPSL